MVKVTDADREAAETCRKMTAEWQRHFLAEAFARHRIAGVRAGLEKAAEACQNLGFFTDIDELMYMTKQDMSERTCHEAAAAISNIDPEECE